MEISVITAQKKAAKLNEAERQRKIQNYLQGQAILKAQEEAARQEQEEDDPYEGMDDWYEKQDEVTASLQEELFQYQDEPRASPYVPPDMGWKRWDYEELARYERIRAADEAFDAEVGGLTPQQSEKIATWQEKTVPQWRKTLSAIISTVALSLDITSLAISSFGVFLQMSFAALGLAEPTPGGGEAIGFVAGASVYNKILNPVENWLSLRSALLVTASDILAGNTRFERSTPFPGVHATELIVGQDTLVAWGGIVFGNTPLTPEALTDTAVNVGIVWYDIQRLREKLPTYVECRIGKTDGGMLYFRCTPSPSEGDM